MATKVIEASYIQESSQTLSIEMSLAATKGPFGGIRIVASANANDASPSHVEKVQINALPAVGQDLAVTIDATNTYAYTIVEGDTIASAAIGLANLINAGTDPISAIVDASTAINTPTAAQTIELVADVPGAGGDFDTTSTTPQIGITNDLVQGVGSADLREVGYVDVDIVSAGEYPQFIQRYQWATGETVTNYVGNVSATNLISRSPNKLGTMVEQP